MKHKLILLVTFAVALISPLVATAQLVIPPDIEWQKAYGGSGGEGADMIRQTSDGGYIIVGTSNSTDGDITEPRGLFDYWVIKISGDGSIQWQKSLGGSGIDAASAIEQTTDGGYIISGASFSNDGDVSGVHGTTDELDYWIVKLSTEGNIQWQRALGGSQLDYATSIKQAADGGYLIAGYSESIDGDVSGSKGMKDFWIVKLTTDGTIEWQKSFGGTNDDFAVSIALTADGGSIVAGYSMSNDGDVSGHHGSTDTPDYWIVKLTAEGNIEWQKSLGGSSNDIPYSVRQEANGAYIVSGYSTSNDGDVTGHHAGTEFFDYWIVKLMADGTLEWQRSLGGNNDDYASAIVPTTDGGYIIAGESNSTDGDVTGNHGLYDSWIVKLRGDGTISWQRSLGGSDDDRTFSIQQTLDGGYITCGTSLSNDGDVTGNHAAADFWIVKLSPEGQASVTTPSPEQGMFISSIRLDRDEVTISFESDRQKIHTFEIYDMLGKLITSGHVKPGEDSVTLPTISWSTGAYIVHCGSNSRAFVVSR